MENFCSPPQQWFALRVKSRQEKVVATSAQNKGFEVFLPLYQSRRRWSDREKQLEFPLFPGYLFCRLALQRRLPLLTIPGALHFVGVGKVPMPIDQHEMEAIQKAIRSGLVTEPWPYLDLGQRVRLEAGPLTGLEGILSANAGQQRLVVSVTLLKRSVAVSVARHWVSALENASALRTVEPPASGVQQLI